jgi:hypothetical protein
MIRAMRRSGADGVRVVHVRAGELAEEAWVYAWLRVEDERRVVYVGATGLPPDTRTWLHLHDPDPAVGRVAARYPQAATEPLDVIAVRVPADAPRGEVKEALVAELATRGLLSDRYVGDPPGAGPPTAASAVAATAQRLLDAIVAWVAGEDPTDA